MRILFIISAVFLCSICNGQSNYQTFGQQKQVVGKQDTLLESIFQVYLKVNDSLGDIRHVQWVNYGIDSADKYTLLAKYYLQKRELDSCIEAIHKADEFIVTNRNLLKIPH